MCANCIRLLGLCQLYSTALDEWTWPCSRAMGRTAHVSLHGNSSHLAEVMPTTASEMRVTKLLPTKRMQEKAEDYLSSKGLVISHSGFLCFPSSSVESLPESVGLNIRNT